MSWLMARLHGRNKVSPQAEVPEAGPAAAAEEVTPHKGSAVGSLVSLTQSQLDQVIMEMMDINPDITTGKRICEGITL